MKEFMDKILEKYPAKTFKGRKQHIVIKNANEAPQTIVANTRTIPGMITNRGCCYAGCKGVVLGPIKDMIHIVHGPIGCSYYTWGTRRNKAKTEPGGQNYIEYCFSTDMQESDIIFGGEKKLRQAIKEAVEIFHPKAITISATCPVGLIGDDINAVAAEAEKLYGIQVLAFNCEGYKGVSQSAGHHIANNNLMRSVIGTGTKVTTKKYSVNMLGEYNIGGDGWEVERILKKIGYDVVCVMTGDGSYEDIKNAHTAELNLVQCHRSINYIAEMMETKYGIPWLKVNFIGATGTTKTLRDIALYFGDAALIEKTEKVIASEIAEIEGQMQYYKTRLEGKTACLYVGGSRSHHFQTLLRELGVETVVSGYEFAHRDDYEGREVIPTIKLDADSKNIEHLTVEKDGTIVIDDINHYETEEIIKKIRPDMFFSGIKDRYVVQKMGVMSRQLHSYDYSGPYAGYKGAVIFARDITSGVHTPAWKYVTPPWKVEPLLEGKVVGGDE